jgi:hypothetical protein
MKAGGFPVYSLLARVAIHLAPSQRTLATIASPNDLIEALEAADLYMLRRLRNVGLPWPENPVHALYRVDNPWGRNDFSIRWSDICCYLAHEGFKAEIMEVAADKLKVPLVRH